MMITEHQSICDWLKRVPFIYLRIEVAYLLMMSGEGDMTTCPSGCKMDCMNDDGMTEWRWLLMLMIWWLRIRRSFWLRKRTFWLIDGWLTFLSLTKINMKSFRESSSRWVELIWSVLFLISLKIPVNFIHVSNSLFLILINTILNSHDDDYYDLEIEGWDEDTSDHMMRNSRSFHDLRTQRSSAKSVLIFEHEVCSGW